MKLETRNPKLETGNSELASALRVGGLVPLSTTDYPDHLSAVVFCQGCPWRCPYCHNPHLLARHGSAEIPWTKVVAFLERRRGLLDAVAFSGGEPTLQPALPQAIRTVRAMGYKIALHTAGIHPQRLALVLPLVNWVGMDVKAEFHNYASLTGVPGSGERARLSVELILASGVAHEFRTTMHPALLPEPAIERMAVALASEGVKHYVLQEFRAQGCAFPELADTSRPGYPGLALRERLRARFQAFAVRPA